MPIFLTQLLLALLIGTAAHADTAEITQKADFTIEELTSGLEHPWSLAFLPGGGFLVTERPGRLRMIDADGRLRPQPLGGLPEVTPHGQGGLLDVALHPDFADNRLVYISYSERGTGGVATAVARGRLDGMQLRDTEVLFRLLPKTGARLQKIAYASGEPLAVIPVMRSTGSPRTIPSSGAATSRPRSTAMVIGISRVRRSIHTADCCGPTNTARRVATRSTCRARASTTAGR